MSTPTAIDLFCGAGGTSQGLVQAGFNIIGAIDNNRPAIETYRENHPAVKTYARDVRWLTGKRIRKLIGIKPGELTLLTACPPCQGWSTIGNTPADDPRNELVTTIVRFVRELLPSSILIENVPGLKRDKRFQSLINRCSKLGYKLKVYDIDACDFGVPQRRKRVVVVGIRSDSDTAILPEHLGDLLPSTFDVKIQTVRDAFSKLSHSADSPDPIHRGRNNTEIVRKRIESIPIGGNRFDIPSELQLRCHKQLEGRRATAAYGRMKFDEPAPTLITRCTTPACGSFIHPVENRGITLREAAVLQSFPSDYKFCGRYDEMERQIGNAFPVRVAEALGHIVLNLHTQFSD